jgi:16S rRNA (cytosine967-C5)-methyltransferase
LIAGDAGKATEWWDGRPYDRVLLDVPCSATGVIRRHPDIKVLRRSRDVPMLAKRQGELLLAAGRWSGRVAGCSIPAAHSWQPRNEKVVRNFLQRTPGAKDLTPDLTAHGRRGQRIRARATRCCRERLPWTGFIMLA